MNPAVAFDQLPKTTQRNPFVQALYTEATLTFSSHDYAEYAVSGRSRVYTVKVYQGKPTCDCTAASFGNNCYHQIAALHHFTQHREDLHTMSTTTKRFTPQKVSEGKFEVKQPILLELGFYAGFFRRYNEPQLVEKYDKTGEEQKILLDFLVTHSINERTLPRFTKATCFVPFKRFYNSTTGMESRYFEFEYAMLASKFANKQALADAPEEQIPDLDTMIGWPAVMQVEQSKKADKHGVFHNNIKVLQPVTSTMKQAMKELFRTFEYGTSEKGLRFLSKPDAEYDENFVPFGGAAPISPITQAASQDANWDNFDPEEILF